MFKQKTNYLLIIFFQFLGILTHAQICGIPGLNGATNSSSVINTYYPPQTSLTLNSGNTTIQLLGVPSTDTYGNSFGNTPISGGDLVLFIQIQDGMINTSNSDLYGGNNASSGPDGLGGSGYLSIGNAGLYEYAIALNDVPLTGGQLIFRAAGTNGGVINSYFNSPGNGTNNGKKTFQVIRVPQYSSFKMTQNITAPPFNGNVGGIVAFDVAGDFDLNGYKIDASEKGFRGGFQYVLPSDCVNPTVYATDNPDIGSGKGEGIAGTPRLMWDGYNEVDNGSSWLGFPGFYLGKGAPANAGGGGVDHNSGGGGGGNGGFGGCGGDSWAANICPGFSTRSQSGGRPGSNLTTNSPIRIFMGGGGGGGDANNALNGTKGGVGGGIIIINAGRIVGNGNLISNGGDGQRGVYANAPDGAGGGGAGGTILLKVLNNSTSTLIINAKGGRGGNTVNDLNNEHGPGGGGGGGTIWYTNQSGVISAQVDFGNSGFTNDGNLGSINHGANSGQTGIVNTFSINQLPVYLQGQGANCLPELSINKTELHPGVPGSRPAGNNAIYTLTITNQSNGGGAAGVLINDPLPNGFSFVSATVNYNGGAIGPTIPQNIGTINNPTLGSFIIPAGGSVIVKMTIYIDISVLPGIYHNSSQVLYLDPTRTFNNPNRLITPDLYSLAGQNTSYESGVNLGILIPGENYNGEPGGPVLEDVHIIARGTIIDNYQACENDDLTLNVDPPTLTGPFTYQWNGPATFQPNANVKNPMIQNCQLNNSGSYIVTITDGNGFTSTYSTNLTINSKPNLIINNPNPVCFPNTIDLTSPSITSGSNLNLSTLSYWLDQNVTNLLNAPTLVSTSGTFYIKASSNQGCINIKPVNVIINPKPVLLVNTPQAVCFPSTINLTSADITLGSTLNGGILTYWQDAGMNNSITNPASIQNSGTYYIMATTPEGCKESKPIQVNIKPIPTTRVIKSNDIDCNSITTRLTAFGGNNYIWNPSTTLNNSTVSNPLANPITTTTYHVLVTLDGCSAKDSITVNVDLTNPYSLQIPNAFTPNNDGLNDCFKPLLTKGSTTKFDFKIYNRWGELVFFSNNPNRCWDGIYKGKITQGAYVYYLNIETYCGNINRHGFVLLIK